MHTSSFRPFSTSTAPTRPSAPALTAAALLLLGLALVPPAAAQLTTSGAVTFVQGSGMVPDVSDTNDRFGSPLAAGDFDGDGFVDLAIGIPGYGVETPDGPVHNGGALTVVYGGSAGLDASPDGATPGRLWTKADLGYVVGGNNAFGRVLASGDFDADGYSDLAVGVPTDTLVILGGESIDFAGGVYVMRGSASGLTDLDTVLFHQGQDAIWDNPEFGDGFGASLAAGDFDGDGADDLAVGTPNETLFGQNDTGLVHVVYGTPAVGLTPAGAQFLTRPMLGGGLAVNGERFGESLRAADFDLDGDDELVIGAPGGVVPGHGPIGAAWTLDGSPSGPQVPGLRLDHTTLGPASSDDSFGRSLVAADLNGDGRPDLAVGLPRLDVGGTIAAGGVDVFFGDTPLFDDGFETGDLSTWSIATGD